jgi:hypothetical protein
MTSTNYIPIEIGELPTSASSPLWEAPRRSIMQSPRGGPITIFPVQPTTTIGRILKQVSINLECLIESDPPIEAVQAFVDHYRIPNGMGTSATVAPGRLHPLVQEWFDHKDALEMALKMGREDIATYFLDNGFGVDGEAMLAMCVRSTALFKRVIEEGRWDINRAVSETLPPILAYVSPLLLQVHNACKS